MLRADADFGRSHRAFVRRSVVNILVIVTAALSFVYLTYAILFPDRF
jgi:K+-transporting ATPase KdpF subunit